MMQTHSMKILTEEPWRSCNRNNGANGNTRRHTADMHRITQMVTCVLKVQPSFFFLWSYRDFVTRIRSTMFVFKGYAIVESRVDVSRSIQTS